MTVSVSNTNLVDSFNTWRLNTNLAATVISNNVVTVKRGSGATDRGGSVTGNGHVKGTFTATEFRANSIRAGNTLTTGSGFLQVYANTSVNAVSFSVVANAIFQSNVDFDITGDNRMILPDISRIRISGGSLGQFIRISNQTDTPVFHDITLRDISDMSTNTASLILSGANTSQRFNGSANNSPDIRFSTSRGEISKLYFEDIDGTQSAFVIQLSDEVGTDYLAIRDSANNEQFSFDTDGNVVFNEQGNDADFRVETSNKVASLFVDGGNDRVGINTATPSHTFDVNGDLNANGDVYVGTDDAVVYFGADDEVSLTHIPDTGLRINTDNEVQFRDGDLKVYSSADGQLDIDSDTEVEITAPTVQVVATDLDIDVSNEVNVDNNLTVGGTTTLNGQSDLNGDTNIGNANTDTLTVSAEIDSDLVPATDDAYDLGDDDKEWRNLYLDGVAYIDELQLATGASQGVSSSMIPKTDDQYNLGSTTREWKNLYLDGIAQVDILRVDETSRFFGAVTAETNVTIKGYTTFSNNVYLNSNTTLGDNFEDQVVINGELTVNSNTTFESHSILLKGNTELGGTSSDIITVKGTFANQSTSGLAQFNGNVDLGSDDTDTLSINAKVDTNIVPSANTGKILGSVSKHWGGFYTQTANVAGQLNVNGGIIANGDFVIGDNRSALSKEVRTAIYNEGGLNTLSVGANTTFHDNVTIVGDVNISGALTQSGEGDFTSIRVAGTSTLNGDITLGDADTDVITVKGKFANQATTGTASFNGTVNLNGTTNINGDLNLGDAAADSLTIKSTASFQTNTTIGDSSADTLTVNAHLQSDLIANTTGDGQNFRDLGAVDNTWTRLYANTVYFANTIVDSNEDVLFGKNGTLHANNTLNNGSIRDVHLENSGVTAGEYGSTTTIPVITVNAQGIVDDLSTVDVATNLSIAGDSGTDDVTLLTDTLTFTGDTGITTTVSDNEVTVDLDDTAVTPGEYGSATQVPIFTVDQQGRLTAASEVDVAGVTSVVYTSANNNLRVSTADGFTHDATIDDATSSIKGVASFDSDEFDVSSGAVTLKDATTGAVLAINGTSSEIEVSRTNGTVTVGLPEDVTVTGQLSVGENLVISGNLYVAGTTTTVDTDNMTVKDTLISFNEGAATNANDLGFIFNRGSTGSNAIFVWDESADKFALGTGATSAERTGAVDLTTGTLVANIEGNLTGDVTGTVSDISNHDTGDLTEGSNQYFTQARARGSISVSGSLSYDSGTGEISYTQPTTVSTFTNDANYIDLTDISVSTSTASGGGSLSYDNGTGAFTFRPADLSPYLTSYTETSTLDNVADRGNTTAQTLISSAAVGFQATNDAGVFQATGDALELKRSSDSILKATSTEIVLNEGSLDRNIRMESDGNANMFFLDSGTSEIGIKTNSPDADLHVNGTFKAGTTTLGATTVSSLSLSGALSVGTNLTVTNSLIVGDVDSNLTPEDDNGYNLGSSSKRWKAVYGVNFYTGDMNLNNTNYTPNEVDGTQGSWTIQEGADDLFIINRVNGKKYKFKLEEMD